MEKQKSQAVARPAAKNDQTGSLTKSFTVTGATCEIRGDVINISAGRDVSTYPLPKGCALTPR